MGQAFCVCALLHSYFRVSVFEGTEQYEGGVKQVIVTLSPGLQRPRGSGIVQWLERRTRD